jgi:hypothetical protein
VQDVGGFGAGAGSECVGEDTAPFGRRGHARAPSGNISQPVPEEESEEAKDQLQGATKNLVDLGGPGQVLEARDDVVMNEDMCLQRAHSGC